MNDFNIFNADCDESSPKWELLTIPEGTTLNRTCIHVDGLVSKLHIIVGNVRIQKYFGYTKIKFDITGTDMAIKTENAHLDFFAMSKDVGYAITSPLVIRDNNEGYVKHLEWKEFEATKPQQITEVGPGEYVIDSPITFSDNTSINIRNRGPQVNGIYTDVLSNMRRHIEADLGEILEGSTGILTETYGRDTDGDSNG